MPYIPKEPKNDIERRALREIEAIKHKREEKMLKQQYESDIAKQKEERQKQSLKSKIEKRHLELGVSKGLPRDTSNMLLTSADLDNDIEVKVAQDREVRLVNLETDEEDRDRDGVKIILHKYNKVFKFLFNKYAMSRSTHKKVQSFDYYSDKTINVAELSKLLRDHDFKPSQVNKDQLQSLVRLINLKINKRADLSALDFVGFMEWIVQISLVVFDNTEYGMTLPQMVQALLKQFEGSTKAHGQSIMLYEDPDTTSIGDNDLLKEMNKRLKENPDYPVPDGYLKVSEKEQVFEYLVPEEFGFSES